MKNFNKYITPRNAFLFICVLEIVLFFIYAPFLGKDIFIWVLQQNHPLNFGIDFFTHIQISGRAGNIYNQISDVTDEVGWGNFPPFTYCFYRIIYFIINKLTIDLSTQNAIYIRFFIFSLYLTLSVIFMYLLILKICRHNISHKLSTLIFFCIFFSSPMMGGVILTGNSTILVVSFILLFLWLGNSDSKVYKELSILFLAIAVGFKIYPAIFVILYLKDEKYMECIRFTLYSIIFLFSPFVFFGGFQGICDWIKNIIDTMNLLQIGRIEDIKELSYMIIYLLSDNHNSIIINFIPSFISIFFLVTMIVLSWKSTNINRCIFFLTSSMIFFPVNAWRYTLCYLCIPFIFWFIDVFSKTTIEDWILGICYSFIFSIPVSFGIITNFKLNFGNYYALTYVELWIYCFAYFLVLLEIFIEIYNLFYSKFNHRTVNTIKIY